MDQKEALSISATPPVSAALLEAKSKYSKLNRENKQLNRNLVNVKEIADQLVKTLNQLNVLLGKREVTDEMKEQFEIGELLGQILDEGYSINQWMGRYLLGAKVEARELIKQAMVVAEIVSAPSMQSPKSALTKKAYKLTNYLLPKNMPKVK